MSKLVRVKPWEELITLGDYTNILGIQFSDLQICFRKDMAKFCNQIVKLDENGYYKGWKFAPVMYTEIKDNIHRVGNILNMSVNTWWKGEDDYYYKLNDKGDLFKTSKKG